MLPLSELKPNNQTQVEHIGEESWAAHMRKKIKKIKRKKENKVQGINQIYKTNTSSKKLK